MHIVCPHPHNLFRSIHIHFLSAAQERCWAMNEIEAKKLKSLFIFFYFLHRKTNLKPSFQSPNLQVDWLDERKGEKKQQNLWLSGTTFYGNFPWSKLSWFKNDKQGICYMREFPRERCLSNFYFQLPISFREVYFNIPISFPYKHIKYINNRAMQISKKNDNKARLKCIFCWELDILSVKQITRL